MNSVEDEDALNLNLNLYLTLGDGNSVGETAWLTAFESKKKVTMTIMMIMIVIHRIK